ncbi:60S ribosomal protein L18a-1 [Camellia lanceoleosa]|uniref:60S ribosomal protein L18a-1 n=1 Tax=Camellia lanceoleosa TaxID=1840588 RepID=A0ACC0IIB3_9ERIC|nr:60S ribosomal protein L18a-1 [Camellia lanceoleosa]
MTLVFSLYSVITMRSLSRSCFLSRPCSHSHAHCCLKNSTTICAIHRRETLTLLVDRIERCFGVLKCNGYQIVGRTLPMESDQHPKIYRMKLWATNEVLDKIRVDVASQLSAGIHRKNSWKEDRGC